MMIVKSGLISEGHCSTLQDYDRAADKIKISRTEDCEMYEQSVYASRGFAVERKMLSRFVISRGEGDGREEIWVAKLLFLCRCFLK